MNDHQGNFKSLLPPPLPPLNLRTANICWTDRTWPLYDAFVVHLRVVGLTSDPHRNAVVRKLRVRPEPFAEGAMRYAFPAITEDGQLFVLKDRAFGGLGFIRICS